MENRREPLRDAAVCFAQRRKKKAMRALFGFDGYIDSLYAVAERTDEHGNQTYFQTSDAFLACLAALNGHSGERELRLKSRRAGGNAPLTAMAAGALGVDAHCMAFMGKELAEFQAVRSRCRTTSLGAPAECMAFEFADSKWMFSNCESLRSFNAQMLEERSVGFADAFGEAELIALLNWAAMPQNVAVVQRLLERGEDAGGLREKIFFIDFSDVSALAEASVRTYLSILRRLAGTAHVIVSVNLHEAQSIAALCQADCSREEAALLRVIQAHTGAQEVVLHAMDHALCLEGGAVSRCEGAYLSSPAVTTGGGDHFNGGYCAGRLAGLCAQQRLALATGTALFYVAHGYSGTAEALEEWLSAPQTDGVEG